MPVDKELISDFQAHMHELVNSDEFRSLSEEDQENLISRFCIYVLENHVEPDDLGDPILSEPGNPLDLLRVIGKDFTLKFKPEFVFYDDSLKAAIRGDHLGDRF